MHGILYLLHFRASVKIERSRREVVATIGYWILDTAFQDGKMSRKGDWLV